MLQPRTGVVLALLVALFACGGEVPPQRAAFVEQSVAHYEQVERELLSASAEGLRPEQEAARSKLIEELRAYRERREFTVNDDFPGARVPYFVDDEGRRCAVAHLLHRFGRDDIVARVAATDNHAWVSDLTGDAELTTWLGEVGLTAAEAARIQVPGRIPQGRERTPRPGVPERTPPEETPEKTPDGSPQQPAPAPPGETSPGDTPASGGEDTAPDDSPGAPPPPPPPPVDSGGAPGAARPPVPTPRTGGGSIGGGSSGGRPGGGRTGASSVYVSWYLWWELNKLDFLEANPLRLKAGPVTGEISPELSERNLERIAERRRQAVLPQVLELLTHADARVRAAAVITVGRMGGDDAVQPLLGMLADPQQWVRERTILALGATGSKDVADTLLRIARTGTHETRGRGELSSTAKSLAVLSLGLLHRYGVDGHNDAAVARLVAVAKRRDIEDVGGAGLMYGILAPGEKIDATTLEIATDRNAPDPVRARAIERLGTLKGAAALRQLQEALSCSRVELRRSAAVALGGVSHDLVLPRMMTAYELENEPMTRGFLLLAIAEQGGEKATRFLARELDRGPAALKPWAALALGLAARAGDHIARDALREVTLPASEQGAVWLARGLARDEAALPALVEALSEYGSPRDRGHAATALALIGGERARHALLSRVFVEHAPAVQVVIAQCIGIHGVDEDSDILLEALKTTTRPEHSGVMAVGLGFHGGAETLDGLVAVLGEDRLNPVVQSTVVTAIGLLLDRRPGLEFPALSRRTNFSAAPKWLYPVLLSTL